MNVLEFIPQEDNTLYVTMNEEALASVSFRPGQIIVHTEGKTVAYDFPKYNGDIKKFEKHLTKLIFKTLR